MTKRKELVCIASHSRAAIPAHIYNMISGYTALAHNTTRKKAVDKLSTSLTKLLRVVFAKSGVPIPADTAGLASYNYDSMLHYQPAYEVRCNHASKHSHSYTQWKSMLPERFYRRCANISSHKDRTVYLELYLDGEPADMPALQGARHAMKNWRQLCAEGRDLGKIVQYVKKSELDLTDLEQFRLPATTFKHGEDPYGFRFLRRTRRRTWLSRPILLHPLPSHPPKKGSTPHSCWTPTKKIRRRLCENLRHPTSLLKVLKPYPPPCRSS